MRVWACGPLDEDSGVDGGAITTSSPLAPSSPLSPPSVDGTKAGVVANVGVLGKPGTNISSATRTGSSITVGWGYPNQVYAGPWTPWKTGESISTARVRLRRSRVFRTSRRRWAARICVGGYQGVERGENRMKQDLKRSTLWPPPQQPLKHKSDGSHKWVTTLDVLLFPHVHRVDYAPRHPVAVRRGDPRTMRWAPVRSIRAR